MRSLFWIAVAVVGGMGFAYSILRDPTVRPQVRIHVAPAEVAFFPVPHTASRINVWSDSQMRAVDFVIREEDLIVENRWQFTGIQKPQRVQIIDFESSKNPENLEKVIVETGLILHHGTSKLVYDRETQKAYYREVFSQGIGKNVAGSGY